jgi:hypothetical protein
VQADGRTPKTLHKSPYKEAVKMDGDGIAARVEEIEQKAKNAVNNLDTRASAIEERLDGLEALLHKHGIRLTEEAEQEEPGDHAEQPLTPDTPGKQE